MSNCLLRVFWLVWSFPNVAGDVDHLIVGDFVAEEVRLHTLGLKCFL
jgi:hypothetical protein